jgi:putative endonuclease
MSQQHFVYIVECANRSLYTGYTIDVAKRIAMHNAGKGARYTRSHLPVTLLASWTFSTKGEALRIERAIKALTRGQKLRLIADYQQGNAFSLPGSFRK